MGDLFKPIEASGQDPQYTLLTSESLLTERLDHDFRLSHTRLDLAPHSPTRPSEPLRSLEEVFDQPTSRRFSAQPSPKASKAEEVSFTVDEDGYLLDAQGSRD